MTDFFIVKFLAANGEDSWIVPLLVFVIWIVGSIFKAISETKQAKKQQRQQNKSESARKPKYKPLTDQPALRTERLGQPRQEPKPQQQFETQKQQKPQVQQQKRGAMSTWKSAIQETLEEAYAVQQERVKPEPARRVPSKPVARQVVQKLRTIPKQKSKAKPAKIPIRQKKKFPELEKAGQPARKIAKDFSGRNIVDSLQDRNSLKNAIIYAEILGKPKAFEGL